MTADLTPYDTGARLEPAVWVLPHVKRPTEDDLDRYGKVDLNNDEDSTVATVHAERVNGCHVLVVYSHHTDTQARINLDADLDKIQARILGEDDAFLDILAEQALANIDEVVLGSSGFAEAVREATRAAIRQVGIDRRSVSHRGTEEES